MSRPSAFLIIKAFSVFGLMAIISSCALMSDSEFAPPPRLKNVPSSEQTASDIPAVSGSEQLERFSQPPIANPGSVSLKSLDKAVLFPPKEAPTISLSIDGLSLPAFINEVFANELKLAFQMAPDVATKEDLVTLRITEPRNRQDIFQISRDILASYGIQIMQEGDMLRFVLASSQSATGELPLIVTGSTLPSVPSTHRPIFLIRTLNVISNSDAYSMLSMIYEGQGLKIQRDNANNAVTLRGAPDLVQSAADVLTMLDRPTMKGRYSLRIDPLYTDAESLSKRLITTMSAQGFDVGGANNTITLVPIKGLNALFVFAPDQKGVDMVRQWTEQLDKVVQQSSTNEGFYWYQVRNTGAAQLAETLNAVVSGGSSDSTSSRGKDEKAVATPSGTSEAVGRSSSVKTSGNFVVDSSRNMLLYHGEATKWQELVPLIKELDRAPAQVLVEVIVAEVSLKKGLTLGTDWNWTNTGVAGGGGESGISVLGKKTVGLGGAGFQLGSLNSSGSTRLAINALATKNTVNVLQSPKVLVRSGEQASVSVADEIQIKTSSVSTGSQVGGNTQFADQFTTRSTGIILKVTPTVFSDGRIDMKISQEVSNNTTPQGSPSITSRNIETSLILNDGGSVLLAGLITKKYNKSSSRVPLLGDIPILGHLFKSDEDSADTVELMVLIVPYLIKDAAQAEAVTQSFKDQLHIRGSDSK
jgi:general secretion pathway protein D